MKVTRKIIEIDEENCDGCGLCIPSCAEGALAIVDGKAKVIKDMYCDGLGACLGDCPNDALKIVEREADEFDEEAVEEMLAEKKASEPVKEEKAACGCPSSTMQNFKMDASPCASANKPSVLMTGSDSSLTHWPVQIKLVPPTAPFLKGSDLLIAADCVPVAYPAMHQELLKGRSVMIGCPKFDNAEEYIEKISDVIKTAGLKSLTIAIMEVPCCSGLEHIIKKAIEKSGTDITYEKVTVGVRGEKQ